MKFYYNSFGLIPRSLLRKTGGAGDLFPRATKISLSNPRYPGACSGVLHWTNAITGKGTLITAKKEKAESILKKYFEASIAPLPDVTYPKKAVRWEGTFIPKWVCGDAT